MKKYEYRYTVSFEDTNLVGNVYFVNFIKWQGKCREFFLQEMAPQIIKDVEEFNLALITLNCSCNFMGELKAFDEVKILMGLSEILNNRIKMSFEYFKIEKNAEKIVATGVHEIGCFKRSNGQLIPVSIPKQLLDALQEYKDK